MAKRPDSIPPGTRAPGYVRARQHRVAFVPRRMEVEVTLDAGRTPLAKTDDVVVVEEAGYPPREYIARDGVDMSRLQATEKITFCPFKGLARYYVARGADGDVEDGVWSYEETYLEAEVLRDRVAFDRDKVDVVVAEPGG